MKNLTFSLVFLLLLLLIHPKVSATHVMGGDLTYKHLHDSTYELKFLVYRDCNPGNAAIDQSITYWVYHRTSKNIFINNRRVSLSSAGAQKVNPEAPNCVTPSGVCIESGEYIDTVTLGGDPDGYIVTWYRHERNHDVTNLKRCVNSSNNNSCNSTFFCNSIRNPFGMVWTAEIPSYTYRNSSPQFLTVPVPYFCVGVTNAFNHVAFDPDGDSLYYEISHPLSPQQCIAAAPNPSSTVTAPSYSTIYQQVVYQSGYNRVRPFGTSANPISINSETGEIRARPISAGNYVIAITISEYRINPVTRQATYLGEIRRDLQFIAGTCPINQPPTWTSTGNASYKVDPGDTVTFSVSGSDNTDTLYLRKKGNIFGGTGSTIDPPFATFNDTDGYQSISQTFKWVPTCDHITFSTPHTFTLSLSDEGCNTLQRTYSIAVNSRPILKPPKLTCLEISGSSSLKLSWQALQNVPFFKSYKIYRAVGNGSPVLVQTISDSSTTTWTDNSANNAQTTAYRYSIRAENSCDLQGLPSDSLYTVALNYSMLNDKAIALSWNPPRLSTTNYQYIVRRKVGGNFVTLDSTYQTSFVARGCDLNTEWQVQYRDTSLGANACLMTSQTLTSTDEDVTGPNAGKMLNVSVINWGETRLTMSKSPSNDAMSYRIQRAINGGSFSQIASITPGALSDTFYYSDKSSLNTSANSYCYRIVSVDSCGNVGNNESNTHCTSELSVSPGQLESDLFWNGYTGYTASNVFVQRYDTTSRSWDTIATLAGNAISYTDDDDLVCNQRYFYRVISQESGGSSFSISDSAFATVRDTIKPDDADFLSASNNDDTSTVVRFRKVKASDVNQYIVIWLEYNSGNLTSTSLVTYPKNDADTMSFIFKTPNVPTRQYCMRLFAVDSCSQNFSNNSELHCAVHLTGTEQHLQNRLSWTAYSGFNVANYQVERFDDGEWKTIATLNSNVLSYTDRELPCNVRQTYRIRINENDASPETSVSNVVNLTPFDNVAPLTPPISYTTVIDSQTVDLNFAPTTSGDVKIYQIHYSVNNSAFVVIDTVFHNGSTDYTYTHDTLNTNKNTYAYRVVALDSCAANASINNVSHKTMLLGGEPGNLENFINWTAYEGFAIDEYQVQTLDKSTNVWSTLSTLASTTSSFTHQNVNCTDTIVYRIVGIEDGSNPDTSISNIIWLNPYDTTRPEPPVIKALKVNGNNITLTWENSVSDDVSDYIVFRRRSGTTAYTALDTLYRKNSFTENINTSLVWEYALKSIDSCVKNVSYLFSKPHNNMVLNTEAIGCAGQIDLSWNPYINFPQGIDKYEVYRSVNNNPEILLSTLNASTTTFSDNNVSQHLSYSYRIQVIENGSLGENSSSKVVQASPYITPPPVVKHASKLITDNPNGEVLVEWESQEGKPLVAESRLYGRLNGSTTFNILQDNIPLTDSAFTQTGLNTMNANYDYFLVNIDSCSNVSDTVSIHTTMDMEFSIGQLLHELQWTAYQGFNIQQYVLQQLVGSNWINLDTLSATDTFYNKSPAPCNTVITYRIAAYHENGYFAYSDTTSGLAIDSIPPDAPEMVNLSTINNTTARINFTGVDSLDVYGFAIMRSRNGNPFLNQGIVLHTGPKQNSVFNDVTRVDSNRFCYYVVALDSCLNATSSDTFCNVYVGGTAGNYQNELSWYPFIGYDIASYRIEVQDNTGSWIELASVSGSDTFYTHQDVGCNTAVTYRIRALESNGSLVSISNYVSLTPFDTIPPAKPSMIASSVLDSNLVEISWEWDTDSDEKFFDIYRGTDSTQLSFVNRVTLKNNYTDTVSKSQDIKYFYHIQSIDSCSMSNISAPSDTINTFLLQLAKDTCNPTTYMNWTEARGLKGVEGYNIYRVNQSNNNNSLIGKVDYPFRNFNDTLVIPNRTYCYRIEAFNTTSGYQAFSDSVCIRQTIRSTPKAPDFRLTSVSETDLVNGKVEISWNKISAQEEPYLAGYRVYRADTVAGNYLEVAELTGRDDTFYLHTTNTSTDHHYYRVTGINTCGVDGDTSVLHSPIQLSVVNLNLESELYWTEYFGFDVEKYEIFSSVTGGNFNKIGEVAGNRFTFTDTTVGCGDSLAFYVKAIAFNRLISNSDVESVIGSDTTLPEPVSLVGVSTINNGQAFKIDWNPSTSKDALYYIVTYRPYNSVKWDTLTTTATGTSYIPTGLPTPITDYPYEFQVSPIDSCGNAQPKFSQEHRSISLNVNALGSANRIVWNNYRGDSIDVYELYRNGNLIGSYKAANLIYDTLYNTIDSNMLCDSNNYEYYVRAKGLKSGLVASSNYDEIINNNYSKPNSVYLKSASVVSIHNDKVRLDFTRSFQNDFEKYHILRADAFGQTLETIGTTNDLTYRDEVEINNRKLCYAIAVQDACENISEPSNMGCIVVLEGGNINLATSLKWNDYYQWEDSVGSYSIYKSEDSTFWDIIKVQDHKTRSWVDTNLNNEAETFCYRILAEEKQGIYSAKAWSTTLCAVQEPIPFIPNAFTPGISIDLNDHFGPYGAFIPKNFKMSVFNRWGQVVFNTNQGEYWNGKNSSGEIVALGIYVYLIEFTSDNGIHYKYNGKVHVIR